VSFVAELYLCFVSGTRSTVFVTLLKSFGIESSKTGVDHHECYCLFITWVSLIPGLMARLTGRRAPGTAGRWRQGTDWQLRPGHCPP